jgi:hypothetical protein
LGRAGELPDKLAPFHAALADVGRGSSDVDVTVGQLVTFAEVAEGVEFPGGAERFTFQDPADLAAEWTKYEEMGVSHMILWFMPETDRTTQLLAEALRLYRRT